MTAEGRIEDKPAQPPAELAMAMNAALAAVGANDTPERDRVIAASRLVLARVLSGDCEQRSGALDLLTFDALVTDALEAGATTAAECEKIAAAVLSVIGEATAP